MNTLAGRFHSLSGGKIQEKRREFNLFLKSLQSGIGDTNELTNFIFSINPANSTEEVFRIEILIQFMQYDLLKNELKTNSPLLIRKLLKNWKFFTNFFSSIDAQTFVNDILPYISYSLKSKLLNGICKNVKNEELLDKYFLALEKKYGLKTAAILLPGCTIDLIKLKITLLHTKLINRQLISIFKKDKQFVEYYFDILQKKDANFKFSQNYKHSLRFVAKVDAGLYWKLSEKYKFHMQFGKHMTAKMFRSNNKVLENSMNYINVFQTRQLCKTIRKDGSLKVFLLNAYSKTIESLAQVHNNRALNIFKSFLPKHELYSIIIWICKEKYGKDLLNYPEYCDEDFIKLMPVKDRENILNKLVKKNEDLLYLYQTSKSIPIIKNKLQHSSDANTRSHLIILMYRTCVVNKDKEAFLETLHFVLNRYKNDINVLKSFFNHAIGWPKIITLEEVYWKYIADMAKIIEIIKETYYHDNFYVMYICHLLEYNLSCQEQCKAYIKHIFKHGYGGFPVVDKQYERKFIEQLGECISTLKEHERYPHICTMFLSCLAQYNNRCVSTQIPYDNYSHFFDKIKSNNYFCNNTEIVIEFGLRTYQTEFWHDLFWNQKYINLTYSILSWYLKNYPEKVVQNINKIANKLNKTRMDMFLKKARKVLDKDSSAKIAMHALDNLHSKDKDKRKLSFKMISILKPESLSELASTFLTEPEVHTNIKKPENRVLQNVLIKNLHKLGKPLDISPVIPKFCTPYNFKCILSPIQSVAYHIPELHIRYHLMQFSNKVLPIRRQILILAKDLLTNNEYVKLLEEFCEKETNISIKNSIFMKTLQYFIENPSDFLWTLTQKNIRLLDIKDRDVHNLLLKYENIPHEYLSQYIEFIFEEISNNADNEIQKKRFQLLDSIPSQVVGNLNSEFLKHVTVDTACLENVSDFHWRCIFHIHGEKQEKLFEKNFETLKNFVEKNHVNSNKDPKVRSIISKFFYRFLNITIGLKQGGTLIEKFIASWTSIFRPNTFCKEYTMLLFTNLYFKSNFEATQTGVRINELLYNYIDKYSPSIIPIFSRHLKQFLDKVAFQEQEEIIKFIEGLADEKHSKNSYLGVIHILNEISDMYSFNYYRNNLNIKEISECANPIAKFHYDVYLATNLGN